MRKSSLACVAALIVLPALTSSRAVGAEVPLSTEIRFTEATPRLERTVALVASRELRQLVAERKHRIIKFRFQLGHATTANLLRALESRYTEVVEATTAAESMAPLVVELTDADVQPKLPATTFGAYKATLTLSFAIRREGEEPWRLVIVKEGDDKRGAGRVIFGDSVGTAAYDRAMGNWVQTGRATDVAMAEALDELLNELANLE
jgi:hypothetical protein